MGGHEVIPVESTVISTLTVQAVKSEALRAHLIHKDSGGSILDPGMSNYERLAILVEEVGEVAHALTYDSGADKDKLVLELVQVAAVAMSFVEFLEGGETTVKKLFPLPTVRQMVDQLLTKHGAEWFEQYIPQLVADLIADEVGEGWVQMNYGGRKSYIIAIMEAIYGEGWAGTAEFKVPYDLTGGGQYPEPTVR